MKYAGVLLWHPRFRYHSLYMIAAEPLRIAVVDDEVPILEELAMFDWSKCNCELAGTARSGKEALRILKKDRIDILITDISMPGMDGIELSKIVAAEYPDTQIIFLTLYREFDYAREAIRYGVSDYLLKGVYQDDELRAALKKAGRRIEEKWVERSPAEEALQRFLAGEEDVAFPVHYPVRLAVYTSWMRQPAGQRNIYERFIEICGEHTREIWPINEKCFFAVFDAGIADQEIESLSRRLLKELPRTFPDFNMRLSASVGPAAAGDSDLRRILAQARTTGESAFYAEKNRLLPWMSEKWDLMPQAKALELTLGFFDKLTEAEIVRGYLMRELPIILRSARVSPSDCRSLLSRWCNDLRIDGAAVEDTRTYQEAAEILMTMIEDIAESHREFGRREIEHAVHFMQRNLNKAITLSDVAREVALSPNYLGTLFKQKLGHGFKWYHTYLRLERAAELVQSSAMKIYEIADEIGIANYRYFTQLFHQHFGMSPSEYRSRMNGGEADGSDGIQEGRQ